MYIIAVSLLHRLGLVCVCVFVEGIGGWERDDSKVCSAILGWENFEPILLLTTISCATSGKTRRNSGSVRCLCK